MEGIQPNRSSYIFKKNLENNGKMKYINKKSRISYHCTFLSREAEGTGPMKLQQPANDWPGAKSSGLVSIRQIRRSTCFVGEKSSS